MHDHGERKCVLNILGLYIERKQLKNPEVDPDSLVMEVLSREEARDDLKAFVSRKRHQSTSILGSAVSKPKSPGLRQSKKSFIVPQKKDTSKSLAGFESPHTKAISEEGSIKSNKAFTLTTSLSKMTEAYDMIDFFETKRHIFSECLDLAVFQDIYSNTISPLKDKRLSPRSSNSFTNADEILLFIPRVAADYRLQAPLNEFLLRNKLLSKFSLKFQVKLMKPLGSQHELLELTADMGNTRVYLDS